MDASKYFESVPDQDWQCSDHDDRVPLAVIGIGEFARRRALPAIEEADFCDASVLVTGSPDKTEQVAAEFGIDRILSYEEFHTGIAEDQYAAVYISTPNAHHLEYIETAADLGKDVLCEKPIEATVERAERAVSVCRKANVQLMIGYRLQADPTIRLVREMISDGVIGDPVHVNGKFTIHIISNNRTADNWRLDPAVSGGGALVDVGIYPLNTSRFVLGTDPTAVEATTTTTNTAFADIDEHAVFQMEFPNGVTGSCLASFNAQEVDQLQIIGTDGEITLKSAFFSEAARPIVVRRGLDERIEYRGPAVNEIRAQFDYFADRVLLGGEIEPDGQDGVTDMKIIRAAYESTTQTHSI